LATSQSTELIHIDSSFSFAGDKVLVVNSEIPVEATALANGTVLDSTVLADGSMLVSIPSSQLQQDNEQETPECISSPGR
jgi:hypothetical protein